MIVLEFKICRYLVLYMYDGVNKLYIIFFKVEILEIKKSL